MFNDRFPTECDSSGTVWAECNNRMCNHHPANPSCGENVDRDCVGCKRCECSHDPMGCECKRCEDGPMDDDWISAAYERAVSDWATSRR